MSINKTRIIPPVKSVECFGLAILKYLQYYVYARLYVLTIVCDVNGDKQSTNLFYNNIMKMALQNANGENKLTIANAINKLNVIYFTEVLCTHFLNMIDSSRNPLLQKKLERNTGFLTTIPILHNLFVSRNDILDMQWVEKNASATGNIKWDGIVFVVGNKTVELSGRINFNSTDKKKPMMKRSSLNSQVIKNTKGQRC